jgi:hypothetical protein
MRGDWFLYGSCVPLKVLEELWDRYGDGHRTWSLAFLILFRRVNAMQLFCSTVYSNKQQNHNNTQELLGNHKLKSRRIRSVRVRGVLSPSPDSGSGGSGVGVDPVKVCGVGAPVNPNLCSSARSSRRQGIGAVPCRWFWSGAPTARFTRDRVGILCPELNGLDPLPCRYFFLFLFPLFFSFSSD